MTTGCAESAAGMIFVKRRSNGGTRSTERGAEKLKVLRRLPPHKDCMRGWEMRFANHKMTTASVLLNWLADRLESLALIARAVALRGKHYRELL